MKSRSLRSYIVILMTVVVLLQGMVLAGALAVSNVFDKLDAESYRLFEGAVKSRSQSLNRSMSALIGNSAEEAQLLSDELDYFAEEKQLSAQNFANDEEVYANCVEAASESIISLLDANEITGAFVLFNTSVANTEDKTMHSGVYIRNSSPNAANKDSSKYQFMVGPIEISKKYGIALGENWSLDISIGDSSGSKPEYYTEPIKASLEEPWEKMQHYGYWTEEADILGDGRKQICYTLPLLDNNNNTYGIIGFEITANYFTRNYLPNLELPYENNFYAVSELNGHTLPMNWLIPSGPFAQVHLQQNMPIHLKGNVSSGNVLSTDIESLGEMYCVIETLKIYDSNSMFAGKDWTIAAFVSREALHETSKGAKTLLSASVLITTLLSIAAVFVVAFFSTRKMSGLSGYVKSLTPSDKLNFEKTGMQEIDDLTSALEKFNKSVVNSAKTISKIMDLTRMPMGCFEVSSNSDFVFVTDYIYELLDIPGEKVISMKEWISHYRQLTSRPDENNENVYFYTPPGEVMRKWLRIVEAETPSGHAGIILDVSDDMKENLRLLSELDYDKLTHLYNREAFKRKINMRVKSNPASIGAMIFADLDNLKFVNDTYGHDMGDKLIIAAGNIFRTFEEFGGIASRISGDEFAIYIHGYSNKLELKKVIYDQLEKIKREKILTNDGQEQKIRFSAGIAWYPEDSNDMNDLLKLSDYAMYEAKHQNKGTIQEFSSESYRQNLYIEENRENINKLLEEELIRFAYQPIVDLHTGQIYAYEALMRPMLKEFKSPAEILSVAASQSKVNQLEMLVLKLSHKDTYENIDKIGDRMIFVNSIPGPQVTREDFELLNLKYPGVSDKIVIEITEERTSSISKFRQKVADIKAIGYGLAIDDFGAGYSNEMRILTAKPNIVKIDMAIVQGIHKSSDLQRIALNVMNFCKMKGIRTIAEGVEEEADLLQVMALGADYVQGYFTCRPQFGYCEIKPEISNIIIEGRRKLNENPKK